jgi:endoglucanase
MTQDPARGARRRLIPIALVPLALLATVHVGHALSPDAAARLHARVDDVVTTMTNALTGVRLFTPPASPVKREADALRRSRPHDAALLDRIASQPTAHWIGGWARDLRGEVRQLVGIASASGAVPVLVAYNIPNRDCGGHSAGGGRDASAYGRWIRDFAAGLGGHKAIVVLEPDALGHLDCLDQGAQDDRLSMLRDAVGVLKDNGATVYVDAGNARWVKAEVMATRLRRAALDRADGFALNVSNFVPTPESVRYGERVAALAGNKHFIIDTSRNGLGGNGEWCNPRGQALGALPTTQTGHPLVDAFLWVKAPGQSDGECNGGPAAGSFWTEYALDLARNQPQQFLAPIRVASAQR